MAEQLTISAPIGSHQLAKESFSFLTSVLAGVHRNVQAYLTRSVQDVECGKHALSGSIQGNSNDYVSPSDLEAPILIPARFPRHESIPKQQSHFLRIHTEPTMPKVLNNGDQLLTAAIEDRDCIDIELDRAVFFAREETPHV